LPLDAGPRDDGPEPLFIDRPGGDLFALYHPPQRSPQGGVVYIPPFAEEMNRSRRMAALQARALAGSGWGTLLIDPFGCGDSAGDFADARWGRWVADAGAAIDWLGSRGHHTIALMGLRLGAMVAVAAANARADAISRLLLWQPVTGGKTFLTQFLRIRTAAALARGEEAETTAALRGRLDAGETLEIAGYDIAPALAQALDSRSLDRMTPPAGIAVDWLEVAAEDGRELPPASRRVIEAWREAGVPVKAETVAGEPFWRIEETTLAPSLIARTREIFEKTA
jgi:exosortase A-associated hydrolase 2